MSNKPKICVVIPAKNLHEIKILISEACQHQADIIELRLDYLESLPDFSAIREITDIPLIATCRRYDQRGYKKIPELIRINLLINAIRAKFNYIDLEVNTPHLKNIISKIRHLKGKIIISKHNFNKVYTKKELNNKLIYMRTFNADFYKII